jgi:hypothetical protein
MKKTTTGLKMKRSDKPTTKKKSKSIKPNVKRWVLQYVDELVKCGVTRKEAKKEALEILTLLESWG